jgi:hypothetical protein
LLLIMPERFGFSSYENDVQSIMIISCFFFNKVE